MTRWPLVAVLLGVAAWGVADVAAQGVRRPAPAPPRPTTAPEHGGEIDCRQCHQGKHQGVVRMYLGLGGRGAPTIPSHMLQVRVQCVACHVVPKEEASAARLIGQTFKPTEQACLGCHGDKYRGMLQRWADTLGRMREIVSTKLTGIRAALAAADPTNPKHAQARERLGNADFNVAFVTLGHGAHNVFYAADLLKLSNGWLDEALGLLGKPRPAIDDMLVRGGYCAVLCHEQAGVRQRETVTFRRQKVPHVRHVTELGATCTTCHSAELHKAVTASPATCSACHHSPQNERCESCHRAQSAFYRGEVKTPPVKVEPNVMVNAVTCVGCHDWSTKHSRQTVGQKCVGCHDAAYTNFLTEWTAGLDQEASRAGEVLRRAEAALARERRGGRKLPEAAALVKEARAALALVRSARGVHNPGVAEALIETARKKADEALAARR